MLYTKAASVIQEVAAPYVKNGGVWVPVEQIYTKVAGVWTEVMTLNFYERLRLLDLTTNLKLCVDPGAAGSYPGSGQVLTDLSGQATNFNIGATSGAETSDPTFNGTANGRSSEYFSADGGDYFRIPANPAWIQNLHKDAALATMIFWGMAPAAGNLSLIGNSNVAFAQIGINLLLSNTTSKLRWIVCKTGGSAGLDTGSAGPAFTRSTWQMYSMILNENGGAGASAFGINSAYTTFDGAVSGPSAADATYATEVMGVGNGSSSALTGSGARLGCFGVWEGTALTQAQVTSIFEATRGRYGV